MGLSNSDHLTSLSDDGQDLPTNSHIQEHQECSSSSTPTPPEELNASEFQEQTKDNQEQEDDNNSVSDSALTIEVPSFNNSVEDFGGDDEPRTPTSLDQKIPATTTCPPAPRKPKAIPRSYNKRKTSTCRRISLDLMVVINAMIAPVEVVAVPDILAGDLGAGDHAKKAKKENVTTGL